MESDTHKAHPGLKSEKKLNVVGFHTAPGALVLLANRPTALLVAVGAVVIVLGILRLLGRIPRLSLNFLGRRDTPVLSATLMIVLGGVAIVLAFRAVMMAAGQTQSSRAVMYRPATPHEAGLVSLLAPYPARMHPLRTQ
jgi:hypothetical protein